MQEETDFRGKKYLLRIRKWFIGLKDGEVKDRELEI